MAAVLHSLSSQHRPGRLVLHGLELQEHENAEQLLQQRPRAWLGRRAAVASAAPAGERATACLANAAGDSSSPGSSSEEPSSRGDGQPGPGAPIGSGGGQGGAPAPSEGGSGEPSRGSSQPSSSGPLGGLVAALQDAGRLVSDPAFAEVPVPTIYLGGLPAPIPAGEDVRLGASCVGPGEALWQSVPTFVTAGMQHNHDEHHEVCMQGCPKRSTPTLLLPPPWIVVFCRPAHAQRRRPAAPAAAGCAAL